jgi:RNA polymerase sigma factor (TIGR02999 family)
MTGVRQRLSAGNEHPPVSGEDLLPHVYDELRRLASHQMAGESALQTLQPTALVHEAWLRLSTSKDPQWRDKQHFFASAALAMRRILVDRARAKQAAKRGGNPQRTTVNGKEFGNVVAPDEDERLLALDEALAKFAVVHPEKAQLVQMRYFAGLTNGQASEIMGISEITAKRWWAYARAWLQREITSARSSRFV